MMKKLTAQKTTTRINIGELICALYDEAAKVSNDSAEQRFIVYSALKDLLSNATRRPDFPVAA